MSIAVYHWHETPPETRERLLKRAQANIDAVTAQVMPIIADVRENGDEALRRYALHFDKAVVQSLKATEEDFNAAEKAITPDLKNALAHCIRNVRRFHEEQMRHITHDWMIEIEPGVFAGEKVTPIDSVGLYVPRGKGAFPSALYMLAVPAKIAGVPRLAVVTPPTPQGTADAATLYTARLCGVTDVYLCGGAQAIAALAYGTHTIPRVRKVLGPGSPYVAAAKRILSDILDPGMPAGPSESIILADDTAHLENTLWDILNEAEHGPDSAALLVTHDEALARYVQDNLPRAIQSLPEPHRSICAAVMQDYGGIIRTRNLEESLDFANLYAPEHLHLKVKDAQNVAAKITHAGEILLGEYTPSSLGNYGIGVNHVLPTGGWAHSYSATGVWDFLKRTSISRCDAKGFATLKQSVLTLTEYEGFPAHSAALKNRVI